MLRGAAPFCGRVTLRALVKIRRYASGPAKMEVSAHPCGCSIVSETILTLRLADWTSVTLPTFDAVAWRVSWSLSGNVLAVSTGDNRVSLWKEKLSGGWECIKTIEE
jgi:hypothetical protein